MRGDCILLRVAKYVSLRIAHDMMSTSADRSLLVQGFGPPCVWYAPLCLCLSFLQRSFRIKTEHTQKLKLREVRLLIKASDLAVWPSSGPRFLSALFFSS